jgi:ribosomal protein S18 acetylase RimI-like enzyme
MRTAEAPAGPVHVRRAHPEDARGIATVHVETWQEAHRGLVPQTVLDHLSVETRERFWHDAVAGAPAERRPWIAEAEGRAVGFVSCGLSRDDGVPSSTGEIYAIYVCPRYWRMGIGRLLLDHACRDLREHGFSLATLWVLAANDQARSFYEALRWSTDGATRVEEVGDVRLEEVRYAKAL